VFDELVASDAGFRARFGTERACRSWLVQTRWPDGHTCERCGSQTFLHSTRPSVVCPKCRRQQSILAGTIFEQTKKPIQLWLKAVVWMCSYNRGNARDLQKLLNLNHKTAWTWFHKIRSVLRAHVVPEEASNATRLIEDISWERLETPKSEQPSCCRQLDAFDWLTDAHDEMEELGIRRYDDWFRQLRAARKDAIRPFTFEDGGRGDRVRRDLKARYSGGISERHLQAYLDEWVYFENRGAVRVEARFHELSAHAARTRPFPYRAVAQSHLRLVRRRVVLRYDRARPEGGEKP
jgi:transposase-like protein